jgi:outer membrane protein OmpA-like peptidoglycan-associated protein
MKKIIRNTIVTVGAALFLSACANFDLASIQATKTSNSFSNGLKLEYLNLAEEEIGEIDWGNAIIFLVKADAAASGGDVQPEVLADHIHLPPHSIAGLESARFWLTSALKDGAADKVPYAAAHAQAMFDCWVEEQEEDHQPKDIVRCRAAFEAAMANVDAALMPAPKPMAKPMVKKAMAPKPKAKPMPEPVVIPGPFIVYFDFDSAKLSTQGGKVVTRAVRAAQTSGAASLTLRGHADRAGGNRYNAILSRHRAKAVYEALRSWGVEAGRLEFDMAGEEEPAIATRDGEREALNRRVVITLK